MSRKRKAGRAARLMAACFLPGVAALSVPLIAAADTQGACAVAFAQVPGGAWHGGVWHVLEDGVLRTSVVSLDAKPQITVSVDFYGVGFPAAAFAGKDGGGSLSLVPASQFATFTRVIDFSTSTGSCVATVPVVIDGQSAIGSLAGLVGLLLSIVGFLGFLLTTMRRRGVLKRIAGGVFGVLFGLGAGLLLQEFGVVDPANSLLLAAPLIGLIIGVACPTLLRRRSASTPPTPAVSNVVA